MTSTRTILETRPVGDAPSEIYQYDYFEGHGWYVQRLGGGDMRFHCKSGAWDSFTEMRKSMSASRFDEVFSGGEMSARKSDGEIEDVYKEYKKKEVGK